MISRRAIVVAAAALAAAACGPSKEERLMNERAAACNALLSQPGVTLADALNLLPGALWCDNPSAAPQPAFANDTCGGQPVHEVLLVFVNTDPGLCKTGVTGGCGFFCDVRITDAAYTAAAGNLGAAPLCASQWYGGVCATATWCQYYYDRLLC